MVYFIAAALLVALDQMVKLWTIATFSAPPPGTSETLDRAVSFLPNIMELTRIHNTGCAFSQLEEYTWLLTLTSAVLSVVLAWAVGKKFFRHPLGRSALTLLLAGAVGNLIDRAVYGYVVDMFRTLFMDFAVFNVADICVVVGGILAAVYYLFLYDKLEGRTNEHTEADG